ncbi:MAG: ATPase, T2SS/T4P/T4SS family [archaeon YNP-LCB-003-016]|uniref:type II/IV secretion system ATPase subunit n=1 Tax=Candidatus Culexarchaeum yellowstonense TaxID=2928963 RepID=UPI0026EF64DF|nr:ATPase, T2SS/T4P/T4SS family [Candidatus Culexarchaeum yellowstonense]MCR6692726.1 ATPase, T2SS/T4P/T4SS family [Candidatus Culexarchaeum yellowstonense]
MNILGKLKPRKTETPKTGKPPEAETPPQTLEEAEKLNPHLQIYLKTLKQKPTYQPKPELTKQTTEETIYPLPNKIFIHIKPLERRYIIIEPEKPPQEIMEKVEEALAKIVMEENIEVTMENKEETIRRLTPKAIRKAKIKVKGEQEQNIIYHMLREKLGYGFLDPFLLDEMLEDISIPGAGNIFVYHRAYGYLESNINVDRREIDRVLRSMAERHGKIISHANPILDIHLPDGSRLNIVFGEDISLQGSNFTIRKFAKEPLSIAQLCQYGTLTPEMAAYMWMLMEIGVSIMICGETASGKTTTLTALLPFIPYYSKIVSIEETPEVRLPHKNWVREVTRLHTGSPVTMFDLVKAALRQRPDYIVIGEIRGEEGRIAFQAINTGHPVIATFHAGTLTQLFQRLTSDPINVPKTQLDGLNITIFQSRIERGGKFIRRVTTVNEILGYNPNTGNLLYLPTFIYDPDRDKLDYTGMSMLLETKVLPYRGWGRDKLDQLYREMKMRAEIIEWHMRNAPRYLDLWRTMIETAKTGIEAVHQKILRGEKPWTN